MKVLLAVASKHGSTDGIAQAIGVQLRMEDLDVDRRSVEDVKSLEGYDAVVLGSAVYMGKLLPEASAFVEAHRAQLNNIPVWVFSSGPIGAPDPKPVGEAVDVEALVAAVHARDHKGFAGWHAIESWAREIARQLTAQKV